MPEVAAAAAPFEVTGQAGVGSTGGSSGGAGPATAAATATSPGHLHLPLVRWCWDYFSGNHAPTRHMRNPSVTLPSSHIASSASASAATPTAAPAPASSTPAGRQGGVVATALPPLFFQHDGHSRTIIGIECTRRAGGGGAGSGQGRGGSDGGGGGGSGVGGAAEPGAFDNGTYQYTLLVLDPSIATAPLVSALRCARKGGGGSRGG